MGRYEHAEISLRMMREEGTVQWRPTPNSRISHFYKNQGVLVTGATGFLGKLLVEKLLRACPEISGVFILVRPKKGEDENSRIDKLYNQQIYGPLAEIYPKFQHKIQIIKGDISLPNLGLTDDSLTLIQDKVNVIFHIAATVRFDEKLAIATAINVRATRDLINIARKCKRLESFVHVSTAFANCNQKEIKEAFYKPSITARELINIVEEAPEELLSNKAKRFIKPWPNSYTYTKAVGEEAVKSYGTGLPICVIRPSIVCATYKEPLRSWIDNLYGATGIILGAGTGLLHTINCIPEFAAEIVPADYVINCMLAASYQTAIDKSNDIPIYNYVSSPENKINWKEFSEVNSKWGLELPTTRAIWYMALTLNRYYVLHWIYTIFFHFLPAIVMDLGMLLTGHKPIMLKIYKKIVKFESVIRHFCTNEWKFHNDNTQELWKKLSDEDKVMFPFSMKQLDWLDYFKTHILGLRIYLVKDDISTLPQARVKWRRLYVAHIVVKTLIHLLLLYIVYFLIKLLFNL